MGANTMSSFTPLSSSDPHVSRNVRLGSLRVGDHMMDEDGDIYHVLIVENVRRGQVFGPGHLNFGLLCLTDASEDIVWTNAAKELTLSSEWVWHSRFGALV